MRIALGKNFLVTACLVLGGMIASPALADPTPVVVDFESVPGSSGMLQNGYGGINWDALGAGSTDVYMLDWQASGYGNTGYQRGATSGTKVAYNYGGASSVVIGLANGGVFDFLSANWTAAWAPGSLTFEGWLNGTPVVTSAGNAITTAGPSHIALNWQGIDQLRVLNAPAGLGYQWVMDDFTYAVAAVPEPTMAWLLLLGLPCLFAYRRRHLS